ncbi:Hypothetical protein, putative [Bodo saltans]|uniref:Uncharacterized protein n=1 Tax=Bodo saltans TaxID=75058 RepID=A0A0S4J396_BODSA|nr:Hypothetical protein, putative [Bodo saltans]|eukprot:CUG54914.1 Hypothetical protein, putative [Bodo saltans]
MSAGPNKPFVTWETPDYEACHNGQARDMYEIQRLADMEAARYIIQSKVNEEDEYEEIPSALPPAAASPERPVAMEVGDARLSTPSFATGDKLPLALMVELALQEALSIATIYERRGLRLNEKHRKLLEELGKLADA